MEGDIKRVTPGGNCQPWQLMTPLGDFRGYTATLPSKRMSLTVTSRHVTPPASLWRARIMATLNCQQQLSRFRLASFSKKSGRRVGVENNSNNNGRIWLHYQCFQCAILVENRCAFCMIIEKICFCIFIAPIHVQVPPVYFGFFWMDIGEGGLYLIFRLFKYFLLFC